MNYHVLYNPLAGNGDCKSTLDRLTSLYGKELCAYDITKITDYKEFYGSLLKYILNSEGRLGSLWNEFKRKYESSLAGDWNYHNIEFGNVTWFFEEGAFLEIVNNYDSYFQELQDFLKSYDINNDVYEQCLPSEVRGAAHA